MTMVNERLLRHRVANARQIAKNYLMVMGILRVETVPISKIDLEDINKMISDTQEYIDVEVAYLREKLERSEENYLALYKRTESLKGNKE